MEQPIEEFTTRDEIAEIQASRLPQLGVRILLHPRPKEALEEAAREDAVELAAAEVVESGREFAALTDDERREILAKNFRYTRERNRTYMRLLEEGRN